MGRRKRRRRGLEGGAALPSPAGFQGIAAIRAGAQAIFAEEARRLAQGETHVELPAFFSLEGDDGGGGGLLDGALEGPTADLNVLGGVGASTNRPLQSLEDSGDKLRAAAEDMATNAASEALKGEEESTLVECGSLAAVVHRAGEAVRLMERYMTQESIGDAASQGMPSLLPAAASLLRMSEDGLGQLQSHLSDFVRLVLPETLKAVRASDGSVLGTLSELSELHGAMCTWRQQVEEVERLRAELDGFEAGYASQLAHAQRMVRELDEREAQETELGWEEADDFDEERDTWERRVQLLNTQWDNRGHARAQLAQHTAQLDAAMLALRQRLAMLTTLEHAGQGGRVLLAGCDQLWRPIEGLVSSMCKLAAPVLAALPASAFAPPSATYAADRGTSRADGDGLLFPPGLGRGGEGRNEAALPPRLPPPGLPPPGLGGLKSVDSAVSLAALEDENDDDDEDGGSLASFGGEVTFGGRTTEAARPTRESLSAALMSEADLFCSKLEAIYAVFDCALASCDAPPEHGRAAAMLRAATGGAGVDAWSAGLDGSSGAEKIARCIASHLSRIATHALRPCTQIAVEAARCVCQEERPPLTMTMPPQPASTPATAAATELVEACCTAYGAVAMGARRVAAVGASLCRLRVQQSLLLQGCEQLRWIHGNVLLEAGAVSERSAVLVPLGEAFRQAVVTLVEAEDAQRRHADACERLVVAAAAGLPSSSDAQGRRGGGALSATDLEGGMGKQALIDQLQQHATSDGSRFATAAERVRQLHALAEVVLRLEGLRDASTAGASTAKGRKSGRRWRRWRRWRRHQRWRRRRRRRRWGRRDGVAGRGGGQPRAAAARRRERAAAGARGASAVGSALGASDC